MDRSTTNFATSGLPGQHEEMTDDESSRDSGISMTMEGFPTCFSSLQSNFDNDAMEVEEAGSGVVAASPPKEQKMGLLRRYPSSQRKLFDESPVSHTKFVRPVLTLRDNNQELSLRHPKQRKRSMEDDKWVPSKKEKRKKSSHASDHHHLEYMDVEPDEADQEKEKIAEFTLQSTSRVSSFVRHHSTAAIMQHDKENEEVDKEADGHLIVNYQLNTISVRCSTTFRRITAETLCDVMRAMPDHEFNEKFMLIDCRYPFEFEGGHIKNSINFFNRDQVSSFFFKEDNTPRFNKIPIFYCEFSQKRGPSMAYALREDDRKRNEAHYPHCAYEEMYVVDKGFREFFEFTKDKEMTSLCEPENYVRMLDANYAHELKDYSFHRRGNTGATTVMRYDSVTRSTASSSNSTMLTSSSVSSSSATQNSTPAGRAKQPYCRTLFQNNTSSPTYFPQNSDHQSLTPPSKAPLCQPEWSPDQMQ